MKTLLLLFSTILVGLARAAEPSVTYEGEVAGIFCSACSGHVKAAMMTVKGVQSARILAPQKGGLPRLQVISTRPITREEAMKALGDQAKIYNIRSLDPVKG